MRIVDILFLCAFMIFMVAMYSVFAYFETKTGSESITKMNVYIKHEIKQINSEMEKRKISPENTIDFWYNTGKKDAYEDMQFYLNN